MGEYRRDLVRRCLVSLGVFSATVDFEIECFGLGSVTCFSITSQRFSKHGIYLLEYWLKGMGLRVLIEG